jgi:hypothetical protein
MFIKKEFEEKMRKKSVTYSLINAHPTRLASRPRKISMSPAKSKKSIPKSDPAVFQG